MNFSIVPVQEQKQGRTDFYLIAVSPINGRTAYQYVHDPLHKNKPEGSGWESTDFGWSKDKGNSSGAQMTFSPEVNVPVFNKEKTEDNIKKLSDHISSAIKEALGKEVGHRISSRKSGRYMEAGVIYKEASFSVDIKDINEEQAEKIARKIADKMQQSSVLVFNNDTRKVNLVFSSGRENEDFELTPQSKEFFLKSTGNNKQTIEKIDESVRSAMGSKVTGWTTRKIKQARIRIGKDSYINTSHAVSLHGIEEEDAEKIAKYLTTAFETDILCVDLKNRSKKIIKKG
ncbi:MAG: hypothetical protein M0P12_04580 [Paludibacteraceae bacterium]|nr:hypothetical protein [Paludibacteraceae bacterium]MCK9615802.1 hypothetical protein [Candidatus Omnitrophota bacterium]